jgi:radical SAM-linked protein
MRVRLKYTKLGPARFVGMRELITLWGRVCRRARLPIAYTQGYHPLPRIDFGPVLAFGLESQEEICDISLKEPLSAPEVAISLNRELPTGFTVVAAGEVPLTNPSVEVSIRGFCYEVATTSLPAEKQPAARLAACIAHFHALPSYPMQKPGKKGVKTVDAHHFITALTLLDPSTITVETVLRKEGTLKPHEFIGTLLGLSPEETKRLRVTKTKTLFHEEGGRIPAVETAELFPLTPLR